MAPWLAFGPVRTPARLPIGLALLAVVGLSSCGFGGGSTKASTTTTSVKLTGFAAQSPQTILAATCGATLPLNSVTVDTTFSKPVKVGNLSSMHWVMSDGADAGTLTYVLNKKQVSVQLYVQPYISYVKAPAAWWSTTSVGAGAANYADKWISIPANSAGGGIVAPLLPFSNLTAMLENCTRAERTPTKGSLGQVGQDQTIEVAVNGGFVLQTFFVPTMSAPFLRQSTKLGALGLETSKLSGYNTTKIPAAPTGSVPFENPGTAKK